MRKVALNPWAYYHPNTTSRKKFLNSYPLTTINSDKLLNHFLLAFLANKFVKNTVIYGATNRPDAKPQALFSMFLVTVWLTAAHDKIEKGSIQPLSETILLAMSAKLFKVGNCQAQASHALGYLITSLKITHAEIFRLQQDHAFLVIGREPNSDPSDYMTWGKNAVICDPWSNRYFPASDLRNQLNDIFCEVSWPPIASSEPLITYKIYSEQDISNTNHLKDTIARMTFWERKTVYSQYQDTIYQRMIPINIS